MVPARTRALERSLLRRRQLSEQILTKDAHARWGARNPEDERRAYDDLAAAGARMAQLESELEELVETTRAEEPDAIEAWAAAHSQLLQTYLGELDEAAQATEAYVAREELQLWGEVREGRRSFVKQNVYYVRVDAVLYRSLFGFDPA